MWGKGQSFSMDCTAILCTLLVGFRNYGGEIEHMVEEVSDTGLWCSFNWTPSEILLPITDCFN